jgi:hypothetical protein
MHEMNRRERLAFILSLPERCLRALASLFGGTALLIIETLVPAGLKGTTLYRILIGDGLRFIIERVAGIPAVGIPAMPADYQQRKLLGSAIEGLSILAVQFSPLWVFAIASDAVSGGQTFLLRLVEQLKRQGVIAEGEQIDDLTDLLDAFQTASRTTVGLIDTPPLTRAELEQMANEMRLAYGQVFRDSRDLVPRFERIWRQMNEVSALPQLSLTALARFMSLEAHTWVKRSRGLVKAMGVTGSDLFGEHVLEGYQRTLDELKEGGPRAYLRIRFAPYRQAAAAQFQPGMKSWTERKLMRRS